mmetsp:Transcript_72594/g.192838  ORF Transcript_72594/g.192838 Transcript_72594/m.192838 type:complete len:215 (-) Transcript_72594:66-710(-)
MDSALGHLAHVPRPARRDAPGHEGRRGRARGDEAGEPGDEHHEARVPRKVPEAHPGGHEGPVEGAPGQEDLRDRRRVPRLRPGAVRRGLRGRECPDPRPRVERRRWRGHAGKGQGGPRDRVPGDFGHQVPPGRRALQASRPVRGRGGAASGAWPEVDVEAPERRRVRKTAGVRSKAAAHLGKRRSAKFDGGTVLTCCLPRGHSTGGLRSPKCSI